LTTATLHRYTIIYTQTHTDTLAQPSRVYTKNEAKTALKQLMHSQSIHNTLPDTNSLIKKLKPDKFFTGKPSQNYGVPPKYGAHDFLPAARCKRAHPTLTQAGESWYSIYLPRRDERL